MPSLKTISIRPIATAITLLALSACAPHGDSYTQAKLHFQPLAANEARLVVYEESSMNMMPLALYVDGRKIGESVAGGFVAVPITAGKHMLSAGNMEADAKIAFDAKPGEETYVKTLYNLGIIMNHPQFNLIDAYQAALELPDLRRSGGS